LDESDRNRLEKQQQAVLLAAADMEEAAEAAKALMTTDEGPLAFALETGMVTAYARPFTASDLRVPRGFDELDYEPDRRLHEELMTLRDKVYAHTDDESGREIANYNLTEDAEAGTAEISYLIGRIPIDRERLPLVIGLCERQEDRFKRAAIRLHFMLTGEKPVEYW